MNKAEKQVLLQGIKDEKKVLKDLSSAYDDALETINDKISVLEEAKAYREGKGLDPASKVHQIAYQKRLRAEIEPIVAQLKMGNISTVEGYLEKCYETGFIGQAYSLHGQGIPLTTPIDAKAMLRTVTTTNDNIKLSRRLWGGQGALKEGLRREITRGIAAGDSYANMARNLRGVFNTDMRKAYRIARTEGGRVTEASKYAYGLRAKEAGADIIKQWDAAMDSSTRPAHVAMNGQIRDLEQPFTGAGAEGMFPHDFGVAAMDINCRCTAVQRPKWALSDDELAQLGEPIKADTFDEFKQEYNANATAKQQLEQQYTKGQTFVHDKHGDVEVVGYGAGNGKGYVKVKTADGKIVNAGGSKLKPATGVSNAKPTSPKPKPKSDADEYVKKYKTIILSNGDTMTVSFFEKKADAHGIKAPTKPPVKTHAKAPSKSKTPSKGDITISQDGMTLSIDGVEVKGPIVITPDGKVLKIGGVKPKTPVYKLKSGKFAKTNDSVSKTPKTPAKAPPKPTTKLTGTSRRARQGETVEDLEKAWKTNTKSWDALPSDRRYDILDIEQKKWAKTLTDEQKAAIEHYTSSSYEEINTYARFGTLPSWYRDSSGVRHTTKAAIKKALERDNELLKKAFNGAELKQDIRVTRGVSGDYAEDIRRMKIGETTGDQAVMSTSYTRDPAFDGLIMDISVPKGKGRGSLITDISVFGKMEKEYLMRPGAKLRLVDVDEGKNRWYFELVI